MNEIRTSYSTGTTIYALVRRAEDIKWFNGSGFEAYNASHWSNYAVSLTETSTLGEFSADFPTAISTAGIYDVLFYSRTGGSPATTDIKLDQAGSLYWDGTAEITIISLDDLVNAIGTGTVSIVSSAPVSQDSSITIFRGDDYYDSEGRALYWTTSDASTWPTLTGATIHFTAVKAASNDGAGDENIVVTGSVVTDTGANKKVMVELSSDLTTNLVPMAHGYYYDVEATLTNGHKVTLASGTITVRADYTRGQS